MSSSVFDICNMVSSIMLCGAGLIFWLLIREQFRTQEIVLRLQASMISDLQKAIKMINAKEPQGTPDESK